MRSNQTYEIQLSGKTFSYIINSNNTCGQLWTNVNSFIGRKQSFRKKDSGRATVRKGQTAKASIKHERTFLQLEILY